MYFLQLSRLKEHAVKRTSADTPVGVLLIKKQIERKEFLVMVCMSLMKQNKLQLNYSKTHYLLFDKQLNRSCSTNFNVSLNSIKIKRIRSVKYLRIYFDENLNWSRHIQHLSLQLA